MSDRPPLPDIDYVAACEAAAKAIADYDIAHGLCTRLDAPTDAHEAEAAAAVDAVRPILHDAAYAQGRSSVQAEAQRARTAVHRYFGHEGDLDTCTVGICWTITHPDGPDTAPWEPSADEALDAASQLISYANNRQSN